MSTPQENVESSSHELLGAFHAAAEEIGEEADLAISSLVGIASQNGSAYDVSCAFSRQLDREDLGTVLGTLLGTHAIQHGWAPGRIAGFLLQVIANRPVQTSITAEIPEEDALD